MLSSPGCWAAYNELLAKEYSDYTRMHLHRLTVDVYAVQHPGVNVPAAKRSVALHLSRLCLLFEGGWPIEKANDAMRVISAKKDLREWLEPPSMLGTLSVLDVLGAVSIEEHNQRVERWAKSVWNAWKEHHGTVKTWCGELL
jgi:hypothetical protein